MPEKYLRLEGNPILVRHTGATTLPERPPFPRKGGRQETPAPRPPVIVCIHDAGLQSSVFSDFLGALENLGMLGLAFDFPGHDRSGSLDALSSISAMTGIAGGIADGCELERIVVLGHGMGALVALDWAEKSGTRIEAAILCGAGSALTLDSEAVELMRHVSRGKAPRPFDPKRVCPESGREMMRRAYMEGIRTDPRATLGDLEAIQAWKQAWNPASKSTCEALEGRVFLAEGSSEPDHQRGAARENLAPLYNAEPIRIDSAGHFLPLEQPQALANSVERIVTGLPEANPS